MRKLLKKTDSKKRPSRREYIIYSSLVAVGVFFAAAALRVLIGGFVEDAEARAEYEQLREDFPVIAAPAPTPESTPALLIIEDEYIEEEIALEEETEEIRALSLDELAAINRDFIGWMTVGSSIDYPVVRGSDNSKYIGTTFAGARNTAGAIFMDYRHTNGFGEQVCTIYGHYTRDGSMFAPLIHYLDQNYMKNNPNINVTTRDGRALTYRIFAARLTDAWDIAYTISVSEASSARDVFPNVPENANRFLLLSTCTRGGSEDERILVYAAAAD